MALTDLFLGRPPVHTGTPEARRETPQQATREELVAFLEEAQRGARMHAGKRFAVTYLAQDRIGLLADVAGKLAQLDLNVEAASVSTLGPFAVLTFVLSSARSRPITEISSKLEGIGEPQHHRVFVVAVDSGAPTIPTSEYALWHVELKTVDRVGVLARTTKFIAEAGGVLVRFSTSVAKRPDTLECDISINFALPIGSQATTVIKQITDDLGKDVVEAPSLVSIASPREHITDLSQVSPGLEDALFVCIVGEAKVGLIASVATALAHVKANVLSSSMAILEGRTIAVFGIAGITEISRADLEGALEEPSRRFRLKFAILPSPESGVIVPRHTPYKFRLVASEQTGVVAAAARVFATNGVNIESVYARVAGRPISTCNLRMTLMLGDTDPQALESILKKTEVEFGWDFQELKAADEEFSEKGFEDW